MEILSRRKFLGSLPALVAVDWRTIGRKLEASTSPGAGGEWNLRDHVSEWIRDYPFPFDRRLFLFPERVSLHKYDFSRQAYREFSPDRRLSTARINLWTKTRLDIKIRIAASPDRLPTNALEFTRLAVAGSLDFEIPLDLVPAERVFYQILYREGAEAFRPVSPPRCFNNPAFRPSAVLYALGDHHSFDDRYDRATPLMPEGSSTADGLAGAYFYDFLAKFIGNPNWPRSTDQATAHNFSHLENTFHLAQTLAWIVSANTLPDLVVKGGDDVGIHAYRFERQGLPGSDYEGNAWKLWLKERIVWGILTPLVPILHVEGNHDGGGIWHNPAHPFAKAARKAYWKQPGAREGCSPDENYGLAELAKGRFQIFFIDVVEHSGAGGASPRRPEHYRLGLAQTRWLVDRMNQSSAEVKLVAQHHVLGGWPLNPEGTGPGGYGRGPLLTAEDYARYQNAIAPPLDLEAIQQIELTNLCRKHNVLAVLGNHDHLWHARFIGKTGQGRNSYFIVPGTTNAIGEEPEWWRAEAWRNDYGDPRELRFLSAPVISRIDLSGDRLSVKAICVGDFDQRANLIHLASLPRPGDLVKEVVI
jgi:hypothetical protein